MALFEVAVILHPTQDGRKKGEVGELLYGPSPVMAKDANGAGLKVGMNLKESVKGVDLNDATIQRMEVLVRPFGEGQSASE